MKIRTLYWLVCAAGMLFFYACVDKPTYPSEPQIQYSNFIRYGNPSNPDSVEAVFSFTDNEGDIGMSQGDTFGIFAGTDSMSYGNFWMIYLHWDTTGGTGHWSVVDSDSTTPPIDTFKIFYRVPVVLPEGDPDEPVKGLIYVKQKAPFRFPADNKIMYRAY